MSAETTLALPGPTGATWRRGLRRLVQAWQADPGASAARPACRPSRDATLPPLDFHAEACAPEGALYVDGVLFGHLDAH